MVVIPFCVETLRDACVLISNFFSSSFDSPIQYAMSRMLITPFNFIITKNRLRDGGIRTPRTPVETVPQCS